MESQTAAEAKRRSSAISVVFNDGVEHSLFTLVSVLITANPEFTAGSTINSVAQMTDNFRQARDAYRIRNGYRIAQRGRFERKPSGFAGLHGTSEDKHFEAESSYHRMNELAEDADRNEIAIGQGIDTLCVNILQDGFNLIPTTGDEDANAIIKQVWEEWATDPARCDLQGEFDFDTLSWLAFRGHTVRGDIFGLPTVEGNVQIVENYRCRSPWGGFKSDRGNDIVYGVELDKNRRRVGFHFTEDDVSVNEFTDLNSTRFIPARDEMGFRNVVHLFHPRRVTQTRGDTALRSSLEAVTMHGDINFAKLAQQQGVSSFMMIRQRDINFQMPNGYREPFRKSEDFCNPGEMRNFQDISPQAWYTTFPGERVEGFSPNVPNPTFFDHQKQTLELIALSIDLPLLLFMMNVDNASFSAWRGTLELAKKKFKRYQKWFGNCWHSEFFTWKMRQMSRRDSPLAHPEIIALSRRGVNVFSHKWGFPSWPYIQVNEEVEAEASELRNHLNSPSGIQARHSRHWPDVANEIVRDNALLIRAAKAEAKSINEEFPDDDNPVNWREVAGMATPEGTQLNLVGQTAGRPSESQTSVVGEAA